MRFFFRKKVIIDVWEVEKGEFDGLNKPVFHLNVPFTVSQ